MQLAARALERPSASIAKVAARVGYQSEAAFNRGFKKVVGAATRSLAPQPAGGRLTASPEHPGTKCVSIASISHHRSPAMPHSVKILAVSDVTHNVRRYTIEKPEGFSFEAGQATDVSLDEDGWRDNKHPFTFTSLEEWPHLEFTIKSYFGTGGMTERLHGYKLGQSLIIRDVWGTITYKGPGTFIAGGAGVTPFIAILRRLNADGKLAGHRLIVSNRTEMDIILRTEFEQMRGLEVTWTVTDDPASTLRHERIGDAFLKREIRDVSQNFYLCGPDPMVKDLRDLLEGLGATTAAVTWEK